MRNNLKEQKKKVYVDTNVIVSAFLEDEKQHKSSKEFVEKVILNQKSQEYFVFYTSVFALPELASAIYRRTKNKDRVYSILYNLLVLWSDFLLVVEPEIPKKYTRSTRKWIDRFIKKLIEVAVKYGTPTMDSFHALILEEYHIDILITWNKKDFKNVCSKLGIELLTPEGFIKTYLKAIIKSRQLY